MEWITPATAAIPSELDRAVNASRRRTRIVRYRSRTEVSEAHIYTAYSWLKLPIIIDEHLDNSDANTSVLYRTAPVPRGLETQEALDKCTEVLSSVSGSYGYKYKILMFNTGTAAAATERLKQYFDDHTAFTEMDVATLVTSTPTHKVHMYKSIGAVESTYVILNNVDTPTVLFKIAAAIMLDINFFNDDTQKFATAWLSGNADDVCSVITEYYAEYKAHADERRLNEALEKLSNSMMVDRTNEFRNRMNQLTNTIQGLFEEISRYTEDLNKVKGEYLLYNLESNDAKGEELKTFIKSCMDNISYISFSDNCLYLTYKTKLIFFEPDLLERYFDSTRTNCITNAPNYIQQLLRDIFINKKYDLLIESGMRLNTRRNSVTFLEPINVRNISGRDLYGIPNPHHKYYDCWGDNKPNIVQALIDKNYIAAITTCFAAISGLNISDTAVIEKLVNDELRYYSTTPCLEDKETGEIINIDVYQRRFEDAPNATN